MKRAYTKKDSNHLEDGGKSVVAGKVPRISREQEPELQISKVQLQQTLEELKKLKASPPKSSRIQYPTKIKQKTRDAGQNLRDS